MSQQELEKYTKENAHHGVNESQILKRFMNYSSSCSDPENIFRYMEEKAICTFLSAYWIHKAQYLAKVGDYVGCFQCIELAKDRSEIEEDVNVDIVKKQTQLVGKFMSQMRTFPLKSKRSLDQFQFTSNQNSNPNENQGLKKSLAKVLPIYQVKYGGMRRQKERIFKLEREKLPASWLAEQYEKQEIQEKKIEEKIHQNSMKLSKEVRYHSMHTPIKFRDPQRLTKTMDSVEILRKKRSTNEKKNRNNRGFDKYDSDQEFEDAFELSNTKAVASVPVGKSFSNLKRRVTFDVMDLKRHNIKLSDGKTSPENSMKSMEKNEKEEAFSVDKIEENSEHVKSLPSVPQKLK